jgi:NADH dehydrogenase
MKEAQKVVIVGAGFGGVKAALELASDPRFAVTLVSERDDFEYHAALYRSVTGRSPLEVSIPLEDIFREKAVKLVTDSIVELDSKKKTVISAGKMAYPYDKLILALGNVTAYYGIKGLDQYSYGMKSIAEATRLKNHLHEQMEHPSLVDNHYVIVGGGPTGIELAGELVSYLERLYEKHKVRNKTFQVDLVEAAPTLLPMMPKPFAARVSERLKHLGVVVYTGTAVMGESADKLKLPHGSIKTHTVIWTAGVSGSPFFASNAKHFNLSKGNRVEVDKLLVAGHGVQVIGDAAHTKFSGWAQTALYDGWYVATNLKRQASGKAPLAYHPAQPIGAIPVGRRWCAVQTKRLRLYGYPGWLVRRYVDFKLYMGLLPLSLAVRTWLAGNRVQETCPACRRI